MLLIIFLSLISNSFSCTAQGYKQKVFDLVPGVYRLDLNPYDEYLTFYEKKDLINKFNGENYFGVLRLKNIVKFENKTFEILFFTYFVELETNENVKFFVHEINETKFGPPFVTKVHRNLFTVKSVDINSNLEDFKKIEIQKIVKLMYQKENKEIKNIEIIGLSEYVFYWRIVVIKVILNDGTIETMVTIDRLKEEIKDNNSNGKEKKFKKRGLRIDKCLEPLI
jgi:hypothetical protein